jgi:hypothetical protein
VNIFITSKSQMDDFPVRSKPLSPAPTLKIVISTPGQQDNIVEEIERDFEPFSGGQRPFNHYATVDDPGSPRLSRPFEGLKVECETEIPHLALKSSSSVTHQYLCRANITKLSGIEYFGADQNRRSFGDSTSLACTSSECPRRESRLFALGAVPTDFQVFSNPSNEIYPFPMSPTTAVRSSPPSQASLDFYQRKEMEGSSKLTKLK